MIVFFDKTSMEIIYTESNATIPTLPEGTIEEKRDILSKQNLDFIFVKEEMDIEVYNYKVDYNTLTLVRKIKESETNDIQTRY